MAEGKGEDRVGEIHEVQPIEGQQEQGDGEGGVQQPACDSAAEAVERDT